MIPSLSHFRWREALPRLLADFAIVQACFIASLVVSSSLRLRSQPEMSGLELAATFEDLYLHMFLPLSLIFPAVFLLSGFYTRSRAYALRYKWKTVLFGSTSASLIYLAMHFLINRAEVLPRSVVIWFL